MIYLAAKNLPDVSRGDRLRCLRGKLSQEEAATKAGISGALWSRYERNQAGTSRQGHGTLVNIAQAFGVPEACLLGSVAEGAAALWLSAKGAPEERLQWLLTQGRRLYGIDLETWADACGVPAGDLHGVLRGVVALTPALLTQILEPAKVKPEAMAPPADYIDVVDWCRKHGVAPERALTILKASLGQA